MPNWCENKLEITGSPAELHAFYKKVMYRDTLIFERIIPRPKTMKECEEKYPDYVIHNADKAKNHHLAYTGKHRWFNWYGWQCDYYGTKWSLSYGDCSLSHTLADIKEEMKAGTKVLTLRMWFDTAWSPCEPIIDMLIAMFPNLDIHFAYFEGGCWFAGKIDNTKADGYSFYQCDSDEIKQFTIDEGFMDEDYWEDQEEYTED